MEYDFSPIVGLRRSFARDRDLNVVIGARVTKQSILLFTLDITEKDLGWS
jgi:hypothetical protein